MIATSLAVAAAESRQSEDGENGNTDELLSKPRLYILVCLRNSSVLMALRGAINTDELLSKPRQRP